MNDEAAAGFPAALPENGVPRLEDRIEIRGPVVTEEIHLGLARLGPAARLCAAVGFFEQLGPVLDGPEEVADVDEIERVLGPSPGQRGIVNLESQIGRDPRRLHRGEVGADDFGASVLVGKITFSKGVSVKKRGARVCKAW